MTAKEAAERRTKAARQLLDELNECESPRIIRTRDTKQYAYGILAAVRRHPDGHSRDYVTNLSRYVCNAGICRPGRLPYSYDFCTYSVEVQDIIEAAKAIVRNADNG